MIGAPQRFSVKHFVSDPHYNHPLLSVLPANAASLLNRRLFGEAVYEVETLPTRAKTKRELVARGLELQEDPTSASNGLVSNLVDELRQGFVLYGIKR